MISLFGLDLNWSVKLNCSFSRFGRLECAGSEIIVAVAPYCGGAWLARLLLLAILLAGTPHYALATVGSDMPPHNNNKTRSPLHLDIIQAFISKISPWMPTTVLRRSISSYKWRQNKESARPRRRKPEPKKDHASARSSTTRLSSSCALPIARQYSGQPGMSTSTNSITCRKSCGYVFVLNSSRCRTLPFPRCLIRISRCC